jgi:hypothetical protein
MARRALSPSTALLGSLTMRQLVNVNPTCEHGLYLRLFITCGGGL